ncbi:MAG: thermonuclease family protein [Acidimicrobiales bacterium]
MAVILALALTACSGGNRRSATPPPPPAATTAVVEARSPAPTRQRPSTTASSSSIPQATALAPAGFAVRSVVDGDTVTLMDGRQVRLAQVDAPETNECFGAQSTQALRTLVEGRNVTVRRPSNGPEKDAYGRTLAELTVAGRSVNEQLVRDGAAEWYEQFEREDADLAARLRSGERDAKAAGRGLWSACGAGAAAPRPALSARGSCHPAYPDDCIPPPPRDLDCPDIKRRVRVDHSQGDPHRFDANRDGWGCESYGPGPSPG